MQGFAILMLIGLALAYGLSVWFVVQRLRRPPRKTYTTALARGVPGDPGEMDEAREFQEATLPATDGLPAWRIRGRDPDGPVVVCSPGWGDSKLGALVRLAALEGWASEVIALDAPGMGDAPGLCNLGTRRDVEALAGAARCAAETGSDLVLFGWSLGGGVAIDAGVRLESEGLPVRAVIAEAPYRVAPTPARNVIRLAGLPHRANLPVAMAILGTRLGVGPAWKGFDRAGISASLRSPLLVVHGSLDEVCPIEDGREIASRAPFGTIAEIGGGMHNDLWTDDSNRNECTRTIGEWVERTLR